MNKAFIVNPGDPSVGIREGRIVVDFTNFSTDLCDTPEDREDLRKILQDSLMSYCDHKNAHVHFDDECEECGHLLLKNTPYCSHKACPCGQQFYHYERDENDLPVCSGCKKQVIEPHDFDPDDEFFEEGKSLCFICAAKLQAKKHHRQKKKVSAAK